MPGQYNTWIPVKALEELQEKQKAAANRRQFAAAARVDPVLVSMYSGMRWGDIITNSDESHDAPYVSMSSNEWIAVLKECRVSKRLSRTEVTRIQKARDELKSRRAIVVPERSRDADYRYWKKEYTEYGYLYFSSEESQQEALEELEETYSKKSNSRFSALL